MAVERFPIESAHVMMFARAIGDSNPIYYDEQAAKAAGFDGIVVPPTFAISDMHFDPETGLRPKIGQPWHGSGKNPTTKVDSGPSEGGVGLHAEEHFEYIRPLRVGDILTRTAKAGEKWEREGRRGGTLRFAENIFEYRDQTGELVLIARQITVRTERTPEQS